MMPQLPPLRFDYLSRVFFEVGPTLQSGMGPAPLSHQELRSYQDNVGLVLSPWEVRTLRRLSAEWIGEAQRAEAHDATPPWTPELTPEHRAQVAERVRNFLRE